MTELTAQDLGLMGEQYVAGELVMRGIPVKRGGPADLLIHGDTPLEVKTARFRFYKRGRQGFQFCMERAGRGGLQAPVVVLVCWQTPPYQLPVFVIPKSQVADCTRITIPSEVEQYGGKWAVWLNQWELLTCRLKGA